MKIFNIIKIAICSSILTASSVNADTLHVTAKDLIRTEDQTYLTLPEWYLVHSPEEYAQYLGDKRKPSQFPFSGHIGQFWDTYKQSYLITKDKYPLNMQYHIMVMTIGVSTTVEYTMKGLYESFIGSITEYISYDTQEDRYAAKIAKNYVNFIKVEPWYKFDFMDALTGLWKDTDFFGDGFVRKIERKYFLTTEYLAKASYGYLIKKVTGASFETPIPYSSVLIKGNYPANAQIGLIDTINGNDLLKLPRYNNFTINLIKLAEDNKDFIEICGNKGKINIAILPNSDFDVKTYNSNVFIIQSILTQPSVKRVVYEVDVSKLSSMIRDLDDKKIKIEHIYDY